MNKIKPNGTFLVRTKCDQWDNTHTKTIKEEIEVDKAYLKKIENITLPILATSSKKPISFESNELFCKLLTGEL